jgi:tetratricopeptide (TPR) repeat protein
MNFTTWAEPAHPHELLLNQSADLALQTHNYLRAGKSLPKKLRGAVDLFLLPNPGKAHTLVEHAQHLYCASDDAVEALFLLERAIMLDHVTALDAGWYAQRADLYERLGISAPRNALRLYSMGSKFKLLDAEEYSQQAYAHASVMDERFLWPANNFAWNFATGCSSGSMRIRKGLEMAEWACAKSGWGCWCFINTLAASYARMGDFTRAVAWQEISIDLAPEGKKSALCHDLLLFQKKCPIQDVGEVAAGGETSLDQLTDIEVDQLWAGAVRLINTERPTLH